MNFKELLETKNLLLWDFDGTLVNSEPIHHLAYTKVLARHGCEVSPEDFGKAFSLNGLKAIQKLGLDPLPIYWEKQGVYQEILNQQLPDLCPYIPEILRYFHEVRQIEMVIVTNSYREFVQKVIQREGWGSYFTGIYTREIPVSVKPSHELYSYALAQHQRQPHEGLVFEDGLSGVRAALAAGLDLVWFQSHALSFDDLAPIPLDCHIEVFTHETLWQTLQRLSS